MKKRTAFTVPQLLIAVVAFVIFMVVVVALASGADKENVEDGGNCSSFASYDVTRFTTYGGDCKLGCGGWLSSDYAFTKNSAGVNARSVNVKKGHPEYAPTNPDFKGIFREVSQDPLLQPGNTTPVLIEYNDPDFGWVKIVARTSATKIFQQQGTVINVIPTNGPQFKAIVADRGMTPGDNCPDPSTCASLDLLKTSDLAQGFVDGLNLKGKIEIVRYGPDGEVNCSDEGSQGNADASSGVCYRGAKILNYTFNSWELTSSERACLSNSKVTISNPKTPASVVAAGEWLLTKPKVPYSMACRNPSGNGWKDSFGTSCNRRYNGNLYPYTGLDCSSFVSWAYRTAGYSGIAMTSSTFYGSSKFQTVKSPQAGDILVTRGHVILIGKVYSNTKVDLIETSTWGSASDAKGKSVHIHQRASLIYDGGHIHPIKGKKDSREYIIRRIR